MHPAGEEQRQPDRRPRREEWSFQPPVNWLPGEKRSGVSKESSRKSKARGDREMSGPGGATREGEHCT